MSRLQAIRRTASARVILLATGAALTLSGIALAEILEFGAPIDGKQAANCAGTGSEGTGFGYFTLDTETGEVNYNITFQGLGFPETVAHVHAPAPPCSQSTALYDLPTGSPKIGSTTLDAGEMQDMIDGLHYINIHTTEFAQAGEIRGQILLAKNGVPTTSEWGIIFMATMLLVGGAVLISRRPTPA